MARMNAAEAMPDPQEESESQKALREAKEASETPTSDTMEALDMVRELSASHEDAKMQREKEEASAAATKEIRETIAARDKAAMERARRALGASVLQELPPEDVKFDLEDDSMLKQAEKDLGPRRKAEPPPIPSAAKKPEAKKPWYKRLFGSKE